MNNENVLFERANGYQLGYMKYSREFDALMNQFGSWGNIPIDTLNDLVHRTTGSGFFVSPNGVFMPNSVDLSSF